MQRETTPSPQFKLCFQMINSINSYCKEVLPELFESLTKLSFVWTIELLYAGDKTQAVGSVLYLSNLMNSKKSLEHFNEYILETFNGLFSLLTKLSCKFSLTIQSKVLELAKAMIINFKKSLSPEEKMPAFKRVTDFLVRLLPQNKMQEQRILITILHTLFSDSLSQASMAELMCGEQRRPEERIKIGDILNHEYAASDSMAADRYPDNCPPLYILLDYIVNTLKSYRTMLQYKAGNSGSGRFLTYDDCSVLTSVVLVMNHLFTKWKVNLDLFERTENTFHFDAYIKEILETLLEIIHENEYFNEKKMEFKGSSIRKEERPAVPNPIRGDPMDNNELASQRAAQVNYKPNPNVYYQNFEYHIYIDDYDFSVQGWSILVENIILFLSTFLVKPEVTTIVKACRTQAQAQAQQAVVHETETEYPVLNLRYQIIAKMFDLFSRLEYRIREAVDKGFKLLLKVETHEREIIPKEQLEQCFKPLLAFMQNQDPQERRNSLNENSMQCFMKLFLLFKGCFNAQRLFEKFTEYLNSFDQILGRDQQTQPREEDISQMNAIFRMISIIIKNTDFHRMLPRGFEIEKKLQEKNVYFYSLKPKLEKLLNGQSSVVISAFTKDKLKVDSYFTFLIDTLKLPESHPLRERICREDPADFIRDLKKDLEEKKQTEAEYEDKLFRWSKIVYVLAKKLPWFLSRNYSLIQFYHEYFKNLIVNVAEASTDEKYSLPTPDQQYKLDMFILTSKILVELVSNCEDPIPEEKINIIFELVDLIDLKICYYSNFVRNLFRDIIPTKFSENQKKQIFMHYFNFYHYVEGTKLSKIKEDRFYLKHVNTELILPMLSHIFKHESTKKSSFILSSEMISKLKAYFSMLTKPGAHQIGLEQMPMHLMVELTILVDFILCKIDFRNLDEPSMKERNKDIEDMLKSLLHLYWKCIAKKQDKSKLLVNLSKLVVSRLISHSKIIGKNAPQIKELYESILIASEDIIDEETKQIWLNVCNVILPQIKDYKNTTTGEQQPYHWFDEFLKLMEETEPTSPQGRDLIDGSNSNRWWIVIFRNRHLMHEFRNQIFDSNRYFSLYTHLRAWISMLKPNYFLYDTLLLYIAWYMKDYRQCMLEGKPPSDIFKLSGVKEEFLLGVLREVIKKDEDYSTGFLNRSYFLFRVFSMFIGRGKLDFDSYIKILSAYKRRGAAGSREDPSGSNIQIKRRLKSNFVIMNICLVILYHPKIKILESDIAKDGEKIAGKDKELMGIIYEYVIKEMPQKLSKEYMKYPYLVTLAYHIIKRILVLSDSETRDSYLDKILAKSNESIRAILSTNRDGNRAEAQDTLSLWIAVLLYKFIYEYKPELLEGLLQDFIELAKLFCENLKNKKASKEVQTLDDQVHFDPDEDIIEKFFVCFNVDSQEPRNISKGYYKGYSVLVMRILMKFVDKDCLPYFDQFSSDTINFPTQKKHLKFEIPHVLLDVCSDLLGNPTPSEYDIKLEIIMLLRCLIIPQSVKSPVYKKLAVDKDFLTAEHKIGILNCLNIEQFLKKNEGRKAFNKIFVETLWDLVIDFIEANPLSKGMIKFLRKMALIDTHALGLKHKDIIFNKINELNQDFHFMKFKVISEGEFSHLSEKKQESEEFYNYVKKFSIMAGAYFSKHSIMKCGLEHAKSEIVDPLLFEPGEMMEEVAPADLIPKNPEGVSNINRVPDVYYLEEVPDIQEHFRKHTVLLKKHLDKEVNCESFFKSYRYILEMSYFAESKNTLEFWKSYIKQLYDQLSADDKTKLWITLQDLFNNQGKSEHDSVFLLETLKVLTKGAPFMLAEELQTLALKPSLAFPFAAITFLEPYLDKTVQKEYSIPEHTMYACFEDLLVKIKEKDLVLGFRKTFLEKDRDKNMLTMLQLRDYHSAEDLCMEAFKDAEIKLPTADSLNEEIHKLILEETWIEIAKNMNDWSELYSISEGSERKDLLLEASFFTGNMEKVEEMFRKYPDEDNTTNCIYYALAILAKDYPHIDQFDNEAVRKFKEKICLMLMKDWFYLPRVFGENHIHQIALSHFWAEFEEGFDILQELRTKRVQNPNYPAHLLKLKEDVTFINMIRRQRLPNEADGLVNCKKIMEQRSVLSHILHSKIKNFIDSLAASPNPLTHFINSNIGDENRYNIFNETLHDAVMYAKIERSYGIYNSIQNICPIIDEKIKQNSIPTQTDEFYYYHEKIKFWTADEENKLPPQNILEKLDEANLVFNKDFKSDLHSTIMRGYLEKGMLEQANKHGIESLKLNEANWKLWTNWFNFYKRAYHQYINTDRSLVYFIEMIKAYGKAIKYKPAQNLILFSEILNILYFRDDLVKSKSKDEEELKARVADAFNDMMKKTPVWTWTAWMGNLIQSVYKKNSFGLDKIIIERLDLASQMYRPFIHYILNSFLGTTSLSGKKDKDLEEILEKCKTYPIGNIKLQDLSVSQLISLYNSEELGNKNRYAERISIVYGGTIESKTANMLMAECKEICDDYNILKNQDLTVKLTNIINIIDQYLGPQKSLINNRTPELNLKGSAIGARFSLLNTSSIYNDRSLTDFFSEGYLLPDIKVVYEARRFSLQVEFSTLGQKKMIYTLRKDITINSSHLMSYNHYLKLMNVEMLRNNETVFRNLRFTPLETQYLEEDYFLKAKTPSEINLIDVLDSEIERLGLKVDHVLENFVVKKQPWEINKPMTEMVSKKIFKQEILKKLKSEYELFLWKKRFAQSLGVNAVNTILFAKDNNFEKMRVVVSDAEYFDDNLLFNVEDIQKNKTLSKAPLRLTQNIRHILNEYIIEGALIPAIGSVGSALWNSSKEFSIKTLMGLFLKDFYMTINSQKDRSVIQKTIDSNLEAYYSALLKMTCNFESSVGKQTRNQTITSLKTFIDTMASEDYLNSQSLIFRVWF